MYLQVIQKLKKGGGSWGKIIFVWFVIGLFEPLICAIAKDKVCDSCILWCPNSNFLCCVIKQNGASIHDLLLYVTYSSNGSFSIGLISNKDDSDY